MKSLFSLFLFALLLNTASAQIIEFEDHWNSYGNFTFDNYGRNVRLPGDLTGDGVPDVVGGNFAGDSAEGANDNVGLIKAINGADGSLHFQVQGPFSFDSLFVTEALPGDLNGDGIPELIATASNADSSEGALDNKGLVRVINGSNGSILHDFYGDFTGDGLGNNAHVVRLNADNSNDIITTAANADTSEGANDDKGLLRAFNGATGATLFSVRGLFTADKLRFGDIGDVNGDGFDDLIAISPVGDSSEGANDGIGYIRVINGNTGGLIFNKFGAFAGDQFGSVAKVLGDTTGDVHSEIVVGARFADSSSGAGDNVGHVAIINGQTGSTIKDLIGEFSNDRIGSDIILAGDLNNDNKPDFVITAPDADTSEGADDDKGFVRAVNGVTGETLYTRFGDFSDDNFGSGGEFGIDGSVTLEDITGDGVKDIIVAAEKADSSEGAGDDVGLIRAFHGQTGATLFSALGSFTNDKLGGSVTVVNDLNGDGKKDLVVTAVAADSAEGADDDVGLVRAISGTTGATLFDVRGDNAGDEMGSMVLETPDFNQDGVPDILAAAREADDPSDAPNMDHGLVKLISGADGSTLFNLYGDTSVDRIGQHVLLPGDLNGDNADNILVSSVAVDDPDNAISTNEGGIKVITLEQCPADPNKTGPGACGCGIPDTDTDSDSTADCVDNCPNDPLKIAAGVCGCGVPDEDVDNDNITDCVDDDIDDGNNEETPNQDLSNLLTQLRKDVKKLRAGKKKKNVLASLKATLKSLNDFDFSTVTLLDAEYNLNKNVNKAKKFAKKARAAASPKKNNAQGLKRNKKKLNKLVKKILKKLAV